MNQPYADEPIFAGFWMAKGHRDIGIVLQPLTVSFERNAKSHHLTLRDLRVCPGAPVWIVDCITIDFPESLTGWRDKSLL